jgi:hypothetical protein
MACTCFFLKKKIVWKQIRMNDWFWFYVVLAIFQPYDGGRVKFRVWVWKLCVSLTTPIEPTLFRTSGKRSFACQGGCDPWHGAPFNVPSDRLRMNLLFKYYWHVTAIFRKQNHLLYLNSLKWSFQNFSEYTCIRKVEISFWNTPPSFFTMK